MHSFTIPTARSARPLEAGWCGANNLHVIREDSNNGMPYLKMPYLILNLDDCCFIKEVMLYCITFKTNFITESYILNFYLLYCFTIVSSI